VKRITFWAVAALLVGGAVVVIVYPVATWHRVYADFWPLDASRVGPNLVASLVQWFLVALVAVIVYPPLRRFVAKEWDHVHAKLDHNAEVLHHIVKHTKAIPDNDHTGTPIADKRPSTGRP
jgi:hypothetical protein